MYGNQRLAFWNGHADATGTHAVVAKDFQCLAAEFRCEGNEQAARSLRIEEQVAEFLPNTFGEACAIAKELPVIFQAAGEKAFARRCSAPGK